MRGLLGDIISSSPIIIIPVSGKNFAQDRVQRLLHTSKIFKVPSVYISRKSEGADDARRFDVPATQVELDDCYETLERVVDFRNREKRLRMCHETVPHISTIALSASLARCLLPHTL